MSTEEAIAAAGGEYPLYLENGGTLERLEWEAAGYPLGRSWGGARHCRECGSTERCEHTV